MRKRTVVVETVLAVIALVMGIVTLVTREWIELLFGFDPDGGSGLVEVLLVAVFFVAAVVAGWDARRRALQGPPLPTAE